MGVVASIIELATVLCVALVGCLVAFDLLRCGGLRLPSGRTESSPERSDYPEHLPTVTIQVPVYCEEAVLDRQLQALSRVSYPDDLVTIQVLDDSPGRFALATGKIVSRHSHGPRRLEYFHRNTRHGYKAGALNGGLREARTELIAILDIDCTPDPDFLRTLVPYFADKSVAAVQSRFRFRQNYKCPLICLQAGLFAFIFHFVQRVAARRGVPALFLGTAAVWRKAALDSLGPWKEHPFTSEDIDMTARCHCSGWRVLYIDRELATSDLVERYSDFKVQQRRWARGALRVAWDHGATLLRSKRPGLSPVYGLGAFSLQLTATLLVTLVPLHLLALIADFRRDFIWKTVELVSVPFLAIPILRLGYAGRLLYKTLQPSALLRAVAYFGGWSLSIVMGFADTLLGSGAQFTRTAKSAGNRYTKRLNDSGVGLMAELLFACASVAALYLCIARGRWESLPLAGLLSALFLASCIESSVELVRAGP